MSWWHCPLSHFNHFSALLANREAPGDSRLPSGTRVPMKGQQDDAASLPSELGKAMELIPPSAIPWHLQGTQGIRLSHGALGRPCTTELCLWPTWGLRGGLGMCSSWGHCQHGWDSCSVCWVTTGR